MRRAQLVIAVTQVSGATAAVATHGDEATLEVARTVNAVIRAAAAGVEGRVIKSLGEGLLLTFPAERARDAVTALRGARAKANEIWRAFDARCELHVTMTLGNVSLGHLGLTDDERDDVWGLAVHTLFKAPATGFSLLPELQSALNESAKDA